MKNYIIAAMIGLTCMTSHAQNVTLFGVIDTSYQSYNNGTNRFSRAGDQGYAFSRFGFRGSEDLGNGLRALYELEAQLNPSSGQLGTTTPTTNEIFSREAWAGLAGRMGEVRLGRTDVSWSSEIDLFSGYNVTWNATPINGSPIEMGVDTKNTVRYTTPNINGLQVMVGHAFGNNHGSAADTDTSQTGASATYRKGNLKLGAGWHKADAATKAAQRDMQAYGVGYDFGKVQASLMHARGDNSTTDDVTSKSSVASVKFPLPSAMALTFSYFTAEDGTKLTANSGKGYLIGATKDLSKRTRLYAGYATVKNQANSAMYLNQITNAPAVLGGDTSATFVGINHRF